MKDFFVTFIIILISVVIFFLFGGFVLLDFKQHFWLATLVLSFAISLLVFFFVKLTIRVEELENKVKEIEREKKDV